jgi:hypothetical protein
MGNKMEYFTEKGNIVGYFVGYFVEKGNKVGYITEEGKTGIFLRKREIK